MDTMENAHTRANKSAKIGYLQNFYADPNVQKLIIRSSVVLRSCPVVVLVMHRHRAFVGPYFYFSPSNGWRGNHSSYVSIYLRDMIKVFEKFSGHGRTYPLYTALAGRGTVLSNSAARN
jgi:hypothetical protein